MKTAQQIIGLPVVSIFDGNEIGKVKNVIINASKGTIDFFVIDSGIRSLAGGVIPADRVLGIGEYALTIQQPDDISDIVKIPAAIELMQKNITVRGTRVLTKKGSLLGETGDIFVNEQNTYNITGVEFVPANNSIQSGIIPRSSIITFGKDLLVVQDDFIDQLIKSPHAIDEEPTEEKKNFSLEAQSSDLDNEIKHSEVINPEPVQVISVEPEEEADEIFNIEPLNSDSSFQIPFEDNEAEEPEVTIPEVEAQEIGVTETEAPEAETSETGFEISPEISTENDNQEEEKPLSAAELFEQRQRQYLLGKKVTKAIYSSTGEIIINNGEIITEELINKVKAEGKLIELVMNYEE
ncbi:MAG: hypothetical protein GX236_02645 [Clostridiaceae bacterium]|nr:hypothetical protein [Clostridiaceae bacterium]